MIKECDLYKKEKNKKVRCLACSHKCLIAPEKTGICSVRKNIDGKLFLLVYGKIASIGIDPIEKKPLYHFLPKTKTYSIGTVGCNFKCDFCQNFEISQISKMDRGGKIFGNEMTAEMIVKKAKDAGCKSISYTYNEPIIFAEFIRDCAKLAHEKGLKNIIVTNGYWTKESFLYLKKDIDAVNIDIKGDEKFYNKLCGARLNPVFETISRCNKAKIYVEVTTLLIPGENDSDDILDTIAKTISKIDKDIPWHITRFFPRYKMFSKEKTPIFSLENAYLIGKKYLNLVYIGNV